MPFLAAMQKLTKTNPDGSIQQLGYHPLYDSVGASFWEAWFWELGGSFLSADSTKVTVANAAGYGALDWLVKQAEAQGGWAQITSYFTAASKSAASTSFLGWGFGLQNVAMEIEVGNVVTNLKAHWPDIHYGAANVPAAADGTRASVRGGYSWVAPTRAAQPDAAWSFLEWVFGIGPMTTFCNAPRQYPDHARGPTEREMVTWRSSWAEAVCGRRGLQPARPLHRPGDEPVAHSIQCYPRTRPGREDDASGSADNGPNPDAGYPHPGAQGVAWANCWWRPVPGA